MFDFKEARKALGLTQAQAAQMMEVDASVIRRMEAPVGRASRREPAVRMVRLMNAYLDGWRPSDWPDQD